MRILMLTAYFPPDTGSASHLFYELGRALTARGHKITVVTSMPTYFPQGSLEKYRNRLWIQEALEGMRVVRVSLPRMPRRLMVGRAIWQFGGAGLILLAALLQKKHDVTLAYSPPLPLGLAAWILERVRGSRFLLNVQDLFPQSIIDLGLVKNRSLIRIFEGMERFLYRRAPSLAVHSAGNKRHVVGKGAPSDRVRVVPNWVDTVHLQPGTRQNNFRRRCNLDGEFVVSFAGILGYSQDLDVVLEAADRLRSEAQIRFLIVGDGVERSRLEARARQMKLPNVRFLPLQTREQYPAVLSASDACLVTLHRRVQTPVVPSKILSAMAAGRPIIAALNAGGDAPKTIREAGCGLVIPPEDPAALAEAVLRLRQDPELCRSMGQQGRAFAETQYSLEAASIQYEELLRRLAS